MLTKMQFDTFCALLLFSAKPAQLSSSLFDTQLAKFRVPYLKMNINDIIYARQAYININIFF